MATDKRYLILEHKNARFVLQSLRRLKSVGVPVSDERGYCNNVIKKEEDRRNAIAYDRSSNVSFLALHVKQERFTGIAKYCTRNQFYREVLSIHDKSLISKSVLKTGDALSRYGKDGRNAFRSYIYALNDLTFLIGDQSSRPENYHYSFHHDLVYYQPKNIPYLVYYNGEWAKPL